MPSSIYEDFAWTPSSSYGSVTVGTAPADGYLWVYGIGEGSGNKYLSIANGRYIIIEMGSSGRADVSVMAWISSGESMTVSSSVIKANETHYCRFYYSVNSAKELGLI